MKEEIIYITPISMPSSSAASKRILGNAKMFNYYGYKTVVFSGKNFRSQKYNYEGIDVFASGIGIEDSKGLKKFLAYRKTVLHLLKKLNQLNVDKIKCIIVYGGYSMYIYFLYKWAKKNKVNICFDAVEWYSPKSKFEWL